MATKIRLKKSGATGNTPTTGELEFGELALNYADGVLYYKDAANTIQQISGAVSNTFETINANGTLLIPDSNSDILSIIAGDGIDITANGLSDTLSINVRFDDTVTSNSILQAATANAVKTAYDLANTANTTAGLAYDAANNAAVKVTANSGAAFSANTLSFNNTATVSVTVTQDGANANISFDAAPQVIVNDTFTAQGNTTAAATANIANGLYSLVTSAANTVRVSQNGSSTLSSKQLNFINTTSVIVNVSDSGDGNANLSFEFAANGSSIVNSDIFSGDGACTVFTLTNYSNTDRTFVYINGISQKPEVDYQVAFKTLTFNVAPANTSSIEVRTITDIIPTDVSKIESNQFLGNGSCTEYTLTTTSISTNSVFVFVDGVTQVPGVDYTVLANVITFTNPPESNGVIEIRSLSALQIFQYANNIVEGNTTLKIDNSKLEFYSNGFNTSTDSISRTYLLRGTTTNNTESEIVLFDGSRIAVAANSTIFYNADIVGRRTDAVGESCGFHIKGVVDNFNGTVADVGSLYELVVAEDDADWAVDARADDTNNSINIYVTGENSKTIRWTALVKTVEVAQ